MDLIAYVEAKQWLHHDIILSLDANEVLGEESIGIATLMWDCCLYDIMDIPEMDPDDQLKDTYHQEKNCHIDYIDNIVHYALLR
jgi:hypothetical protein